MEIDINETIKLNDVLIKATSQLAIPQNKPYWQIECEIKLELRDSPEKYYRLINDPLKSNMPEFYNPDGTCASPYDKVEADELGTITIFVNYDPYEFSLQFSKFWEFYGDE